MAKVKQLAWSRGSLKDSYTWDYVEVESTQEPELITVSSRLAEVCWLYLACGYCGKAFTVKPGPEQAVACHECGTVYQVVVTEP